MSLVKFKKLWRRETRRPDARRTEFEILEQRCVLSGITYTTDADFNLGSQINLNIDNDQVQLDDTVEPFNFMWVAASGRGTVIKLDTETGQILGEYQSAPDGRNFNPSRTTVDANGNVWAGNRDEADGGLGSIVHIGLEENGQCVDRNGNGVIDTSSGLSDIRPWTNAGGVDTNGGVLTAADECIIHYVRTTGTNVRTVAIDGNNDVWVGGLGNRQHQLYDGGTGIPIAGPGTSFNNGNGGYGGLVDPNGVLWSSSSPSGQPLVRHDPTTAVTTNVNTGNLNYGLGIDTSGNIWMSNYSQDSVQKIAPNGAVLGTYLTGGASGDRGVAVTPADNHVWVANSHGSDVSRLDNNGNLLKVVPVGATPTGVAVDAAGKVWVTNLNSNSVMRIDPNAGGDGLGAVDLTVSLGAGALPYNYSDMTGSTLIAPPDFGTWEVVFDSGLIYDIWGTVTWASSEPGDSSLIVRASSSSDGVTWSTPPETVMSGVDLSVPDGRYLKLTVSFQRSSTDGDGDGIKDSPILYDISIESEKVPPVITSLGVTSPVDENGFVQLRGTFTDRNLDDTHTVNVVWGDGTSGPALVLPGPIPGSYILQARHQYLDDGPSPGNGTPQDPTRIDVTVRDDDGLQDTESVRTLVRNLPPSITRFASDTTLCDHAVVNELVNVRAGFTDTGTLDLHTATIDWGDGTTSPGTVVEAGGSGIVTGSHAYAGSGIFEVTLTLTDDDTGQDTALTTVVVEGVGLVDGTLYAIGTDGVDKVHLKSKDKGAKIEVEARLDGGHKQKIPFAMDEVDRIVMALCGGDDHGRIDERITIDALLLGGDGADIMFGGGGSNALVGGSGADHLHGGSAADIVIGGTGQDHLHGGKKDDLLIGHTAQYELDLEALDTALASWEAGDLDEALDALGLLEDDEEPDQLHGNQGDDELVGGVGDSLHT